MTKPLALLLLGCASLAAQSPFPAPANGLPDHPYFVKKTWIIGGYGNWDYLTVDPAAERLYIPHGGEVQVVDVKTGGLVGAVRLEDSVRDIPEAHAVALDRSGEFGYVSDSGDSSVAIFDRRDLNVAAKVKLKSAPRALVYDGQTGLLMAVSAGPPGAPPPGSGKQAFEKWEWDLQLREQRAARAREEWQRRHSPNTPMKREAQSLPDEERSPCWSLYRPWESLLTFIDPDKRAIVAEVKFCGFAGPAVADGMGYVYVALVDRGDILRFDTSAISDRGKGGTLTLDWRTVTWHDYPGIHKPIEGFDGLDAFSPGSTCSRVKALAADGSHSRLFAACDNRRFLVMDTGLGKSVAALDIDGGAEQIAYDAGPGQIYCANGSGGTLSIIHQDVADSYHVVQSLPTYQLARTLAVDSSTGEVYLVTANHAIESVPDEWTGQQAVKLIPQDSSFQVLVVGN